jgi:subtilase family serine protease
VDSISSNETKIVKKYRNTIKYKLNIFLLCIIAAVMLLLSVHPSQADYGFEGAPFTDQLEDVKHGTIKGGVYVGGGHGLGQTPYTQSFNVPGTDVIWARLYVGVWGGTEEKTGSIEVTFNDEEMDTLTLEGETDNNDNVYCSGHGVYWIYYDVTGNTTSGPVDAVITTSGAIDGRVYGAVLVAVYEESGKDAEDVKYWINEGNVNLHDTNEEALANFTGTVNIDDFVMARLTVAYLTSTAYENDYLYFNDEKLCDGDNCDDIANSHDYFDIKTFDVIEYLEKEDNNAKFERGDEDYVHPVLAVLTLHTAEEGDSDLIVTSVEVPILYAGSSNTISATIENIGKDPAYGFQTALYADSEIVSRASISSLAPDKNKTVDFSWKPDRGGEHVLRVYADYNDKKEELRETNNNNTPLTVNVVDFTPPKITIDQPKDGEKIDADVVTVSGTIEDTSNNITVLVNGDAATLSETRWSAPVSLSYGNNQIIVNAVDGANNTATEFILVQSLATQGDSDKKALAGGENTVKTNVTGTMAPDDKLGRLFPVAVGAVLFVILSLAAVHWLKKGAV